MQLSRDEPAFCPVTIRIENQCELDQLYAMIDAVAQNKINHVPQVIRAAAVDFRNAIHRIINED